MKTAALLIGFGGPTQPKEVRPFLESVLRGVNIPEERFQEVLKHYEAVGGVSPYNAVTYRQKEALEEFFRGRNIPVSVGVGFRHSFPSLKDAFEVLKIYEIASVVGFVLTPFRSYASFEKYREKAEEARREAGAAAMEVCYTEAFFEEALFIRAQAERVLEILNDFSEEDVQKAFFIFSAHSIPEEMSEKSGYQGQFNKTASLIAGRLGLEGNWSTAYQSRSGNPREAWLEPDVKAAIRNVDKSKFQNVILVPVGFLCENVEVIYDLDVEAKKKCAENGLKYFRAPTVSDYPKFIEMMGKLILDKAEK